MLIVFNAFHCFFQKVHVVDGVKTEPEQENTNTVEMTETGNMDEDLIKSDDKASKSKLLSYSRPKRNLGSKK